MDSLTSDRERALVLGGGGYTGVAWEIGVIVGLAEGGIDLRGADLVVGTSAGAAVASQVAGGIPLETLYESQFTREPDEIASRLGAWATARFLLAMAWPGSPEQARARLGRASIRSRTGSEAERYEGIKRRLLHRTWPEKRLLITAVEAETGQFVVFDKASGVPVVEAVAASCAVPLIWPPVTINGKRYVDGGVRSVGNVDLAKGYERVVVIAPITQALRRADRPDSQVAALGKGVRSILISPNPASVAAIGQNPLDPAQRAPSAQAGRAQGLAQVDQVRAIWS